ncbi:hypothetical protein Tco_1158949 [Tanacetum coccineum]
MLTEEEQLAADTMQAIKASRKISRSKPHTEGSSEGAGITPEVLDEVKCSSAVKADAAIDWGSEEESDWSNEGKVNKEEIEWVSSDEDEDRQDDHDDDDDQSIDLEKTNDEDEYVEYEAHADEYVHDDVDEEMKDAENAKTGKDDEEITDAEKADAEKSEATKGDYEQVGNLPPTSFSLSVSSGFGNQFLNLSYDISIIGTTKESADTDMNSLLDIQIQQEVPHIQSPTLFNVPVLVIPEQPVSTPTPALPTETLVSTALSHAPSVTTISSVQQQTTPIPTPPITSIASPLTTTISDPLPAIKRDRRDNQDPTAGSDQGKKKQRKEKDYGPPKDDQGGSSEKGKTPSKTSKFGKSVTTEEPDEEHVIEIPMDTEESSFDNAVNNADDQPDNKGKAIEDGPEQTWFNNLVSAKKDLLTFDEFMATLIDFSKFAMNRLKLEKITKADLVGPVYKLLKGTYISSIELEYNMKECYKALSDQLDWENPKGDKCPFNLSKPLPLKGRPGHLTVASEYFFNNDLEYLKSINVERKYTTSITKMKAARYELLGIEDMILKQWSVVKLGYDKDAKRGIKHWGPKRQLYYRSQINRLLKHDVYSTLKILSVVRVKVDKQFGYGYLEEIMVRRADRQLYTFKEGDFINLHLNNIEDMLLLVVQHKLFHLDGDAIVDLAVALRMFTRRIIIQKRVEDVQLGVESYQKKLNITKPQKDFPTISAKEPYTI